MNPADDALGQAFKIPRQTPVLHDPCEGPFDHPTPGQRVETLRTFDPVHHLDLQLGSKRTDAFLEIRPAIASIDPQLPQPAKGPQRLLKQSLCPLSLRAVGRKHPGGQHMAQSIHQEEALASLDPFSGV